MDKNTKKWLYGLGSAVIGGGSASVTAGITSMGIAPDKFNLQNISGIGHLLEMMIANFVVSGFMSMFFFLRQSPLPTEFETTTVTRSQSVTVETTPTINNESKTPNS